MSELKWTTDDAPPSPNPIQESLFGDLVDAVLASDGEWFSLDIESIERKHRPNMYTKLRQVAGSRVIEMTIRGDRAYVRRRLLRGGSS